MLISDLEGKRDALQIVIAARPECAVYCAMGDTRPVEATNDVRRLLEAGIDVVLIEPIALYHERDLHADGDGEWLTAYPPPPDVLLPGEVIPSAIEANLGTGGPGHVDPAFNDGGDGSQGIVESPAWESPLFTLFDAVRAHPDAALIGICHTFGVMSRWLP